jgi:hypothetical protein
MTISPATQEAEMGRSGFKASLCNILSQRITLVWWCTSVIPVMQDAEVGLSSLGKNVVPYPKIKPKH